MTNPALPTDGADAQRAPGGTRLLRRHVLERSGADLEHSRQLNQLGLVLVRVMLAKQQFPAGPQLGAHASSGAATVAAVSPGQFRTGKCCVHSASSRVSLL